MFKINPPMVDDGDGLDQDGRGHVRAADVEQDLGKGQLKVRYGSVQGVKEVIQFPLIGICSPGSASPPAMPPSPWASTRSLSDSP